jgi:hypothetical protein
MGKAGMAKRDLAIAVSNSVTKDKRYQRLLKIDQMLPDLKARCRELYQERIKIVSELYGHGRDANNGSSA